MAAKLLVSAVEAADSLGVSERKFHELRKDPAFPKPVSLGGPRCLRWRTDQLGSWAHSLPVAAPAPFPEHLLTGKRANRPSRTDAR